MLSIQDYDDSDAENRRAAIRMSGSSFAVVDKYQDMVFRAALTATGNYADAEDITQEVFFKYFRQHPQFETPAHEKAWLLRVTINEGKNLRRSIWHRKRTDADLSVIAQPEPEDHSDVLQAVLSLPEKYRIPIYLYYYESYSIKEIAKITAQSDAAVSKQLSRGRRMLQERLGGGRI